MGYRHPLITNINDAEAGFSLAEIVVAIGILAIGITSVLTLFPVGLNLKKGSEDFSKASYFAEQKIGQIIMESRYLYNGVGYENALTDANEYPTAGADPAPFSEDPRFFWHYRVNSTGTTDVYRVDLAIYNIEGANTSTPLQVFTQYLYPEDYDRS